MSIISETKNELINERKSDITTRKIIGLSGRKESGKSELSTICKDYGFEVINFAGAMKLLLANY